MYLLLAYIAVRPPPLPPIFSQIEKKDKFKRTLLVSNIKRDLRFAFIIEF